ncbi:MAG: hypothetical protein CMN65_03655 [Sphingomonadaceae bacterium]|nr:hypothetical protein [Sphingomonadaceae bacterium]|tara:strand:- start:27 stop:692 length:666 start_codon:yes stop_codon:yes gene_type:complete
MSQMLKALVTVAVLFVSAAASADQEETSLPTRDEATRAHFNCQLEQARLLDDGKSDARTIGEAVANACVSTLSTVADVLSQGESKRFRRYLWEDLTQNANTEATGIVLMVRKKEAAPANGLGVPASPPSNTYDIPTDGRTLVAFCGERPSLCTEFAEVVITSFSSGVALSEGKLPFCLPEPYRRFELLGDLKDIANQGEDLLAMPAQDAIILSLMRRYPCA